jgi:hypothetical protein
MDTLMIAGVGKEVIVGVAWDVGASELLLGLGISTKAMLEGVGAASVAGVAQLEKISAQRIRITERCIRCFTSYLNIKRQIQIRKFLLKKTSAK